jgi:hypothetical protein
MPAALVPQEEIPALAAKVTPDMLKVLQRIQREGFILNGTAVDEQTATALQTLADLGLVDPGYEGPPMGEPSIWVSNGNGSRLLSYKTGIRSGPHYEISSAALATWLEQQGPERWWNVDGDPLLTGRLTFPCPTDELAGELQKINRPLLVQAHKDDTLATGQPIGADKLKDVVVSVAESIPRLGPGPMPPWGSDRLLYLCWKSSPYEWLLTEDSETAEQMRALDEAAAAETARLTKE